MDAPSKLFDDIAKLAQQYKLPGVDIDAVLQGRRKDVETLLEVGRIAQSGAQSLAQKQAEMLRASVEDLRTVLSAQAGHGRRQARRGSTGGSEGDWKCRRAGADRIAVAVRRVRRRPQAHAREHQRAQGSAVQGEVTAAIPSRTVVAMDLMAGPRRPRIRMVDVDGQTLRVGVQRGTPGMHRRCSIFNGVGANLELMAPFTAALSGPRE